MSTTQLTRRISNLHTKNHHKRRIIRPRQIIANQAPDFLVHGYEAQTEGAGDVGEEEEEDEDAASVLEAVVEVNADEDGDGD